MSGLRKSIGQAGCEVIVCLTVTAGLATRTVAKTSLAIVNVDTTVQDKAMALPTDARLLHKARVTLVRQARKAGIELRQSYERVGKQAFVRSQRYAHARQMNRAKAPTRKLRTYLGRTIGDIERKTQGNAVQQEHFKRLLPVTRRIHSPPRKRAEGYPPKRYSVHAPKAECIAKGKAHKQYEFGVKVGIVSTSKESFVIGAKSLPGNPYDRHTLQACIEQAECVCGVKRGVTAASHRKLKRRNAVEPVIGDMKSDGRWARNFLKGVEGDRVNALWCGAGHNRRKILKKLRLLCAQWGITIEQFLSVCHIQSAALEPLDA
jgi:transposase, IS5 family